MSGDESGAVALERRAAVERIRRRAGHELSAHAFASLYLWQKQMGLRLRELDGAYTLQSRMEGAWFFPCGDWAAARAFVAGLAPGEALCYLRGRDAALLEREFPGEFRFERRRDADEYLYDIAGHLALSGKAYANLRTQVHKAERDHALRTEALCAGNAADALRVIRAWTLGEHRFEGCALRDDEVDCAAVEHMDELGVEGVVVYLDGEPGAVVAGFALTDDTFDIAVAKCAHNHQGLSYYAKRELMKRVSGRCARINLEEDLGLEGLRRMKLGLQPVGFNEIWRAVRR